MRTYKEVLEEIETARRFGNRPGVEVIKELLPKVGNPQEGIPFIHVAGTNGKGSTCAFLNAILQEKGYKVGCFTSPHLIDFKERITVNGEMISEEEVCRIGNDLLATAKPVGATMFDYCLLMALLYFKEQGCDVMILETGLGGTLDSTNAVGVPHVSVITKIGLDHVAILGNSAEEIARQKAGILKAGTVFVMERQEIGVENVLKEEADKAGVKDMHVVTEELVQSIAEYKMQMQGAYQLENAAAAVLAAKAFVTGQGKTVSDDEIAAGLKKAFWAGRMEVLQQNPFVMIDGAHNAHGVHALKESLVKLYPGEKFHFVLGVLADKDFEDMIAELVPCAIDFTTVTPDSGRALQAEALAEEIQKLGGKATRWNKPVEGLFEETEDGAKTVVLGSLYFIGDLRKSYMMYKNLQ